MRELKRQTILHLKPEYVLRSKFTRSTGGGQTAATPQCFTLLGIAFNFNIPFWESISQSKAALYFKF